MKSATIVFVVLMFLTACVPSAEQLSTQTAISLATSKAAWTQTPTPIKIPTSTPTITPTETIIVDISTETETPTPTPTKITPITEADVRDFYKGKYDGESGSGVVFDAANIVFNHDHNVIMTGKDYETIKALAVNRSIVVFEKNKITVFVDPEVASNAARDRGAAIIVGELGTNADTMLKVSLAVANKQYEDGNKDIRIIVDEIHTKLNYTAAMGLSLGWVKYPEIMPLPKYMELVNSKLSGYRKTLEEAGIDRASLTAANWKDVFLAAGYDSLTIYAQPLAPKTP